MNEQKIDLQDKLILVSEQRSVLPVNNRKVLDDLGSEKIKDVMKKMLQSRLFDEKIEALVKEGIPITQHAAIGQEASQTAACCLMEKQDYVVPNHRGWGWAIAKGLSLHGIMAELMGKKSGYCAGKGGPQLACRENNLMVRSGIQGSYLSIAAGVGMGLQKEGNKNVCLCIFGDGSANAGYVHEGMNMAGAFKLPVIFFCENNRYALFTPFRETTSVEDIALRASGYDMPGYIVDGMDAFAVLQAVLEGKERAKKGLGATLIETKTYRFLGHTTFDLFSRGGYRDRAEVAEWEKRDPIVIFAEKLLGMGVFTENEFAKLKATVKEEVESAAQYAIKCEYPADETYLEGVYCTEGGCE